MSDRLQATDRIEVETHWAPTHYELGTIRKRAEQLRAVETARLLTTAYQWIRSRFGNASQSLGDARVANELSKLDDRGLADIGLDRGDIARAAAGGSHVDATPQDVLHKAA